MVRKLVLLVLLLITLPAWAATISVQVDRDVVAVNETFRIIFKAEGSLDGEPDFAPLNQDFELLGTGQSSQFSMINGNVTSSKTFTLTVSPLRQGKLTIPPISFGRDQSPAKSVTVTSPGQRQGRAVPKAPAAEANLMFLTLEADTLEPYVQQQVILKLRVYRRKQWKDASLTDPELAGVEASIQQLGKTVTYDTTFKGVPYQVSELRFALFPQQSGELTIQPFRVTARFAAGVKKQRPPFGSFSNDPFFDNFFSRQSYEPRSASSKPVKLMVKPIPAAFTGKHWLAARDIQLQETWTGDTSQVTAGEPITRTIAVIGDGVSDSQLPDIQLADSPQYRNYPDQPVSNEQITDGGLLSTRTYRFAIIPTQAGEIQLPAIEIPWWDTRADKQRIARLEVANLSATGSTAATASQTTAPRAANPEGKNDQAAEAARPATSSTTTGDSPGTVRLLLIALVALTGLWLITLLALVKKRAQPLRAEPAGKDSANPRAASKKARARLKKACDQKQAAQVRDALINWAKVYWPDDPATSLETIAARLPADSRQPLLQLSSELYSNKKTQWNAAAIYQIISQLPPSSAGEKTQTADTLEPLYR